MAKRAIRPKKRSTRAKVSSHSFLKSPGLLFSLLIFLAALVLILSKADGSLQGVKNISHLKSTLLNLPTQATSSATPSAVPSTKPSAKPRVVPTNFGRSVRVPILTYHYIGNNPNPGKDPLRDDLSVTPDKFEAQMNYLTTSGYNTISFDTLYGALKGQTALPSKPVILTFDDGYIDFYVNAYPILKSFNLHATSFIPTGKINTSYYLHWDQIKEMDLSGLISFEAHTVNHLILPNLSDSALHYEIFESKKVLEEQLGKKVNFFAYPYGSSDQRVWTVTKQAGFVGAAGTWFGNIETEGTIYNMPRIKISGPTTIEQFKQKLE